MLSFAQKLFFLIFCFSAVGLARAEAVPNVEFQDTFGHTRNLNSLRGNVTVVSFWATWCGPCKEELPRLLELQKLYAKNRVHFVAVSVDAPEDEPKAVRYLKTRHLNFDSWMGGDRNKLAELSLGVAVPATIVLDRNGEIIGRIKGPAHYEDVGSYVDWALHNRRGPRPAAVIDRVGSED